MANKGKKIQKIDDQEDYEKSWFKSMLEDVEETKMQTLESVLQIPKERIPSGENTTNELLEGSSENKKKAKEHTRK
jgi:hypothetical protein